MGNRRRHSPVTFDLSPERQARQSRQFSSAPTAHLQPTIIRLSPHHPIIFSAQSLLLITTLQAIGRTKPILWISLAATIIDLAAVGLGAQPLGTTAGTIGRALLAIGMMTLEWWTLRRVLHVPVTHGLSKALPVTILTAAYLAIIDYVLATNLHLAPLFRLPVLVIAFVLSFLFVCRELSVFTEADFELLENAVPSALIPLLEVIEGFLVRGIAFQQA